MICHTRTYLVLTYPTDGFVFQQHLTDSDYVDSFTEVLLRKHTNEDRIRYAWDQVFVLGKYKRCS